MSRPLWAIEANYMPAQEHSCWHEIFQLVRIELIAEAWKTQALRVPHRLPSAEPQRVARRAAGDDVQSIAWTLIPSTSAFRQTLNPVPCFHTLVRTLHFQDIGFPASSTFSDLSSVRRDLPFDPAFVNFCAYLFRTPFPPQPGLNLLIIFKRPWKACEMRVAMVV